MSSEKQGWITLDSCITDYLSESEQSISKYFKCFNIAFRLMDDLGLDFFYQIATFVLPVLPNQTVLLPANCIKWVKVGVLNANGEVVSLVQNDDLTTYDDLLPNRIAKIQSLAPPASNADFNISPYAYNNYWNGDNFCTLYGLPSGAPFVGSFTVDQANNVIVLDPYFYFDYLVVECVVSPQQGQEYFIPVQFREAIIAGLAWKDLKSMPISRRGNLGDKRDRKHDYYNERRLAIARYIPFRPEVAHQLNIESVRLTIKI